MTLTNPKVAAAADPRSLWSLNNLGSWHLIWSERTVRYSGRWWMEPVHSACPVLWNLIWTAWERGYTLNYTA